LPEFLAERIFAPLGMRDTGFVVTDRDRFTSYYRREEGGLVLADGPDGDWSLPPAFPEGSGGLASTADDWLRFARMLLADGAGLLSPEAVRLMTTDHLTDAQRAVGELFLEGQGWGFGGSVDINADGPGTIPGRYGWVGGSGPRIGGHPAHPGRRGQPGAQLAVPGLLDVRRGALTPRDGRAGEGVRLARPPAGAAVVRE
jgi:CubicO group peptidase (beta-lactamase class C family)